MNIYQITKNFWYFLVLLTVEILPLSLFAGNQDFSGLPYIENFPASVITQRDNNSSIVQDSRDFIYVSNLNGILEFDGFTWRKIEVTGIPILTETRNGQVAFGAFNRLGIIEKGVRGENQLRNLLDSSLLNCGQITSLEIQSDYIYFTSSSEAFLYSESEGLTKVFEGRRLRFVKSGTSVLLTTDNASYIVNTQIKQVQKVFYKPISSSIAYTTYHKAFAGDSVFRFARDWSFIGADPLPISTVQSTDAHALPDGSILLGTRNHGAIILYASGLYKQISTKNGLLNDQINAILFDDYNNIWLALASGVSRVEIPSAYSFYNKTNGLEGKVTSIVSYKSNIYASTSSGTYCLSGDKKVAKVFRSANVLFKTNGMLYAGTTDGLYADILESKTKLFSGNVTQAYVPANQDLVSFIATENEVRVCRISGTSCDVIKTYGPFADQIQSMAYDEQGSLWMGTKYSGLYVAHTDSSGRMLSAKAIVQGAGLPSSSEWIDAKPTEKGVLFSTEAGIYRYDHTIKRFYKDVLVQLPQGKMQSRVYPIIEDVDQNLWLGIAGDNSFSRQIAVAWHIEGKDKYTLINQPFAKSSNFVSDVIFPDKNFVVWFGGHDGVMRLDFKKVNRDSLSNKTFIRSVVIGKDSLLCESPEFLRKYASNSLHLDPSIRSIKFSFVSPYYTSKTKIHYQYRLEGLTDTWSNLTTTTTKEYDRLPEGVYTFRVRSLDELGNYSDSASFTFTVNNPFYQSLFAIFLYIIGVGFGLMIFQRWRNYLFAKEKVRLEKVISNRTEELLLEKEKTERLLSNILPERTVKELKDKGRAKSMRFDMVTVLFSDIQGFTQIAEQMNPDNLVDELDKFFLQFDGIVDQFNIEKIKTIGDAYMCAGGLPQKNRTNPLEVIIAALEIQHYIHTMQEKAGTEGKEYWGLRIGIHTGPVVAGVIGSKKFTYDIWGDTVNIASRMESSGEVGRVNISEDTYLLVNEYFDCEYRGKMPVKYKGEIAMYFVNGFKAHLTEDPYKLKPNKQFLDKLALLKYTDLEEYVLDQMEKKLPSNYTYHNIRHTIDVTVSVELIAISEGVSDEEMLLLKIAALFHDAGFIIDYHDHEQLSIQYANEVLPRFGYSAEIIRKVGDLIYATRLPANPKNYLEEIICDADLDYLGRSDYHPVSTDLYTELIDMGILKNDEKEWTKLQIKFLQNHKYFTDTSKALRNNNKNRQLRKLLKQEVSEEKEATTVESVEKT